MGLVTTLAIASLVVAAGSAYAQNRNSRAAQREQKKASDVSQAENAAQRQSSIRDQVRQQRIRTAQIAQASTDTGTSASSGELGGMSALISQSSSNIGNINRNANSMNAIGNHISAAAQDQSQAATWGAIGGIASTSFNIFSNTPQFKQSMANLFS